MSKMQTALTAQAAIHTSLVFKGHQGMSRQGMNNSSSRLKGLKHQRLAQ